MSTTLSAPLPELDWPDQAIITVASGNANAKVTAVTIHLSQDAPDEVVAAAGVVPPFVYATPT